MKRGLIIIIVLVAGLLLGLPAASARVYIDIYSPYARQFPVAIPSFKPLAGELDREAADALRTVLVEDLDFVGLFKLLDPKTFLVDSAAMGLTASQTNFAAWNMIGAEFLIKGAWRNDGQTFVCELRMFDVKRGQLILGKRYTGTPKDYRLMAHKFADEVMRQVTGELGAFQTRLTYVSDQTGHKEIYVADFDGRNAKRMTRYRSITKLPVWSLDGKTIAFTSYKDGQPYLYRLDLATGRSRRLMGFKGLNMAPAYRPGTDQMVVTLSKDGDNELYLATTRGRLIKRLTKSPGIDVSGSFSPDGSRLAFTSKRHGTPQIFILEMATGAVRRVTYQGQHNTSPSWSPRGDRIAYVGMKSNQFNIFTIAPDGSDRQQLTLDQGDNAHPSWSADGRMIVFSSTRSGKSAIYVMTANGGHVKRLTKSKGNQTSPSWSGRLWK